MNVRTGTYFCYSGEPIDWWAGWMDPAEAVAASLRETMDMPGSGVAFKNASDLAADIEQLIQVASTFLREHGWEGDIRGPRGTWMLTVIPDSDTNSSALVFSVKQDNNGTTFIVSPYELSWLTKNGTLEGTFTFTRA